MENSSWLIDNLMVPIIIHQKDRIEHTNEAFENLLNKKIESDNFNLIKWLGSIILDESKRTLILKAINDNDRYSVLADVSFKGVARQWEIFTSPMPKGGFQVTFLHDESINKVSRSYWDLHTRISKATIQLLKEIDERKKAENKAIELSNELVIAARRAGMTDIATSVLHNVGNILNSVNTSVAVILNCIKKSRLSNLKQVVDLIREHTETQQSKDEKLCQALKYADILCNVWDDDKKNIANEILSLDKNMDYINKIINTQQTLANSIGMIEEISIQDIIHDALTINKLSAKRNNIEIIQNFKLDKKIHIDRVKLLQILTNLVKNSIDALSESRRENKKIIITLQEAENKMFDIQVMDNGIGITAENLNKIYTYGFTTKKSGHGFGLHTSALSAKEMGGTLIAESDGENQGAKFKLTLPLEPHAREYA